MEKSSGRGRWRIFWLHIWTVTKFNFSVQLLTFEDIRRIADSRSHLNTDNTKIGDDDLRSFIGFFIHVIALVIINIKFYTHSIFGQDDDRHPSSWFLPRLLAYGNLFASFERGGQINLITATLLISSTVLRLCRLAQFLSDRFDRLQIVTRSMNRKVNTVQLYMGQISTMSARWAVWIKTMNSGWRHNHPIEDFDEERRLNKRLGWQNSESCNDLFTRLHSHKMICFDKCYDEPFGNYMPHDSADWRGHQGRSSTSQGTGNRIRGFEVLKIDGRDQNLETVLNRLNTPGSLVQVDKFEMSWLISMLIVHYFLNGLFLITLLLVYVLSQLGLSAISDAWNYEKLEIVLGDAHLYAIFVKSIQVFVFLTLFIVAICDLFSFYTCCLICYSRAKYIRLNLRRVRRLCELDDRLFDTSATTHKCPTLEIFCAAYKDSSHDRQAPTFLRDRDNDTALLVDENNQRIEQILELVLIIERELLDLKSFFSRYLSRETTSKALALAFTVLALMENQNIFETLFLFGLGFCGSVPIAIILVLAALIESEFKAICKELGRISFNARRMINHLNRRNLTLQMDFLSKKSNRSFIIVGNFSLSLGSLLPIVAWIATAVVILRH